MPNCKHLIFKLYFILNYNAVICTQKQLKVNQTAQADLPAARRFCVVICHINVPLLHCSPSPATPCLTTLIGPCGLRGRTSVFLYQERVAQVKPKPPRRSCSTTRSPAPPMIVWLHSESACSSLTRFWRYCTVWFFYFHWIIFKYSIMWCLIIIVHCLILAFYHMSSASVHHCLLCAGIWQCQNSEKWQLQPLWKIHGHPVRLQGRNFLFIFHFVTGYVANAFESFDSLRK